MADFFICAWIGWRGNFKIRVWLLVRPSLYSGQKALTFSLTLADELFLKVVEKVDDKQLERA